MKSKLFVIALVYMLIVSVCRANEGSFNICSISNYNIQSSSSANKIIISCAGNAQSLYLNIINPSTFQVENSYQLDGLIEDAQIMSSGESIIVALGELDGNSSTEEGKLIEIDYSTGSILRTLYLDRSPNVMKIDPSETYAFVSVGLMDPYHPMDLLKVSLSSFQIVDEIVFGELTRAMEITPDGSKIYIQSRNIYPGATPSQERWGVAVYDTCNLSRVASIELESSAMLMEMSGDGSRLYISSGIYRSGNAGADLYVVDTQTDQIIESLMFQCDNVNVGTYSLAIDDANCMLYCTANKEVDEHYPYSNMIMQLDLTDYSYSFFTMGDNPIGRIALVPMQNGVRLFAQERRGSTVHYKDIP
jgi:hypothetical protein